MPHPEVGGMKKLMEVDLGDLRWVKTGRSASQLLAGRYVVATLDWSSGKGSLATGRSADGSWTFKRAGFLRPRVIVREEGSASDLALMLMRWGLEGELRFADGARYLLRYSGFWHPSLAALDSQGAPVIKLMPRIGIRKEEASVEVEKPADSNAALLAILGWYVALLSAADDSGVATIAALVGAGAI